MRILNISGTVVGGSGRSQRELAARLIARGHDVLFIVDGEEGDRVRRFAYEQLADLAARIGRRRGTAPLRYLEGLPGRRTRSEEIDGIPHLFTPIPENAVPGVMDSFRPDVVMGNSALRLTWKKVHALCQDRGIGTVLYIREVATLNHFTLGWQPAERIVANATSLTEAVEQHGYPCATIPSVIDLQVTAVRSSRRVALAINPILTHGINTVWALASALSEVPFVIQQSWPLPDETIAAIRERSATMANVEFRATIPAGQSLYADTKVLLVPHRIDNRPRVIAEAQANGIPIVASRTPGLAEAVGDGGILIDIDNLDGWITAVRTLWTDQQCYDQLVDLARAHSRRPEMDPDRIAAAFERLLEEAIDDASTRKA